MEEKALRLWFDPEGDLLEIGRTKPVKGFFRDVGDDVFVRVDHEGNVTGFVILNATKRMAKIREVHVYNPRFLRYASNTRTRWKAEKSLKNAGDRPRGCIQRNVVCAAD